VPSRAEKIPFEPDLDNASGGRSASIHGLMMGHILESQGMPYVFLKDFQEF